MARSILTGWVALWAASLCWAQGDVLEEAE